MATASHDACVSSQERVTQPVPPPVSEASSSSLHPHWSFAAATTSPPSADVPNIPSLNVAHPDGDAPALHNSMSERDMEGGGKEDEEQAQYNALDLTVAAPGMNGSPMHYKSLAWGVNGPDLEGLKHLKDPKDLPKFDESFFDLFFGVSNSEHPTSDVEKYREVQPSSSNGEAPSGHTYTASGWVANTNKNNNCDLQEQQQEEPRTPPTAMEGIELSSSPPPKAAIAPPYILPPSIANAGDDACH